MNLAYVLLLSKAPADFVMINPCRCSSAGISYKWPCVDLPQEDVAVIVGCNTDIREVQFVDRLLHGKSLQLSVLSLLFVFLDRQRFQQPI